MVRFDLKAICMILMAIASMYPCRRFEFLVTFPLTFIAPALVFPIVFSIDGAVYSKVSGMSQLIEYTHGRRDLSRARFHSSVNI